jgi:ribosomal protein L16 Arg81 hydroxylase
MTYYTKFDTSIQCEEFNEVSPEEYDEVMQMLADESDAQEGFGNWSEETERQAKLEQEAFEQSQEKDYLNGYSNSTDGDCYEGISI